MRSLLDRLPLLHSRDIEETRAFLTARAIDLDVMGAARGRAAVDFRLNGVYLSNLCLAYVQYGVATEIRLSTLSSAWCDQLAYAPAGALAPARGDYWVYLPLDGGLEIRLGHDRLDCDRRRGVVISPSDLAVLRTESITTRITLSVRGDALTRHLAALLGDAPVRPLEFSPAIALDEGHGRALARLVRFAVAEFDRDGLLWRPLVACQFEQLVMSGLLLAQPNNYTRALQLRERPIAPRDVRRVIDFIHENVAEPITLCDLVTVSKVAGRTLMKHFRDFNGVPPMRYIRNLRLQRVRDELASGAADRVMAAAIRWGFTHAGRFAVEYRRRFGESPSVTLARGRGRVR